MADNIFGGGGGQVTPKPSKMAFYRHVEAVTNGFKTNDVIED